MSVYAEWYWTCQLCDDHAEEPWGDEQAARDEHDDHMRTYHPSEPCPTCGWTGPQTQYLGLDGTEISHPEGEHTRDWLPSLLARTQPTVSEEGR